MFPEALQHGGGVLYVLLGASILALAIIIERLAWGMRRSRVIPKNLEQAIVELLETNRFEDLYRVCAENRSPLGRIVLAGLRNAQRPREEVVELLQFEGRKQLAALQRYVGLLGTIAAISPLLGLLGTVIGIIETFAVIREHGIGNPGLLAGGISQALIATAAGISVAIPSMIFYRFFQQRARSLTMDLEQFALELLLKLSGNPSAASAETRRTVG